MPDSAKKYVTLNTNSGKYIMELSLLYASGKLNSQA